MYKEKNELILKCSKCDLPLIDPFAWKIESRCWNLKNGKRCNGILYEEKQNKQHEQHE